MGQLHNELRRGPLSNALGNALGDTRGGGLERYGETLQAQINLWERGEWQHLLEILPWGIRVNHAAGGAGTVGTLAVSPSPGLVTVITHLEASAAIDLYAFNGAAPFGTLVAGGASFDSRDWQNTVPINPATRTKTLFGAQNAAGVPAGTFPFYRFHAAGEHFLGKGITLVGGRASAPFGGLVNDPMLLIAAVTQNAVIEISAHGYERMALPGELG